MDEEKCSEVPLTFEFDVKESTAYTQLVFGFKLIIFSHIFIDANTDIGLKMNELGTDSSL